MSKYSLTVNHHPLGKFKSSGIILSTGTGSSGWLYGAKRMTNQEVRAILNEIQRSEKEPGEQQIELAQSVSKIKELAQSGGFIEDELANQVSSETHFHPSKESMYFYVREPRFDSQFREGFAEEVVIESELENAKLCVDGSVHEDINYGDVIINTVRPEYRLKCMKFLY